MGRGVRQDKIFAAGFAHDAREAAVAADVVANRLPDGSEYACRAREMDASEVTVLENNVARHGAVHVN